jgi:putative phage-type endonuclease
MEIKDYYDNDDKNEINILKELLKRPLIKQRTPEWFKLREDRLTASDLYDAMKNPHSLIKRKLKNSSYNSNSIPALKWGTMFEPMATRIYSNIKKKKIYEFGLIINDDIANFGASPDGITEEGIMIEIKCPISREIKEGVIPEKYYYQIQGQLAVCNLNTCDYVECKFKCFNTEEEYLEEIKNISDNYLHGIIGEKKVNNEFIYIYTTDKQTGKDNIKEMNDYKENDYKMNYWKMELINIQEVSFNKDKWDNIIMDKIKSYNLIYKEEKEKGGGNNKDLFIDDD